jgi:hypothetical protein
LQRLRPATPFVQHVAQDDSAVTGSVARVKQKSQSAAAKQVIQQAQQVFMLGELRPVFATE